MKKLGPLILFILIILLSAWSCSQNEGEFLMRNSIKPKTNIKTQTRISKQRALEMAQDAFDRFYPSDSEGFRRVVAPELFRVIQSKCFTNSVVPNDTALYIVNAADDNGFVIINPYERTMPIYAVTEAGNINDFNSIDNPGLRMYLGIYGESALDMIFEERDTVLTNYTLSNLVQLRQLPREHCQPWGTFCSAGQFCPNGCCGCVALSLVMAMAYLEQPTTMPLTYQNSDSIVGLGHENPDTDTLNIDWDGIKQHVGSNDNIYDFYIWYDEPIQSLYRQFSFICRQVGHNINAYYGGVDVTTANESNIRNYINSIGLNYVFTQRQEPQGMNLLRNNNIILVSAEDAENHDRHIWVLDGAKSELWQYTHYVLDTETGVLIEDDPWDELYIYNHFNWGWGGYGNGYFIYGNYQTSYTTQYGQYTHNYNLSMDYHTISKNSIFFN